MKQLLDLEAFKFDLHCRGPIYYPPPILGIISSCRAQGLTPDAILQKINIGILDRAVNIDEDLYRASWEKSGLNGVCASLGMACSAKNRSGAIFQDLDAFHLLCSYSNKSPFKIIRSLGHLHEILDVGGIGFIFQVEDLDFIDNFYVLDDLFAKGVRIFGLAYNYGSPFSSGCLSTSDYGITRFGLDFIKWANDSGAAIDISHCSEKAALKVMELSNNVTCTHSFRKVLNGNPRGKSDKVFTLLAERNGCVGIPLHPGLIRLPSETIVNLETFCTHVKSLVDLIGVQHVCIGSDWVGRIPESVTNLLNETQERGNDQSLNWSADVLGFESFSGWGVLLNALRHSGMSNHEIEYIQGMSFIRSNLAQEKNE